MDLFQLRSLLLGRLQSAHRQGGTQPNSSSRKSAGGALAALLWIGLSSSAHATGQTDFVAICSGCHAVSPQPVNFNAVNSLGNTAVIDRAITGGMFVPTAPQTAALPGIAAYLAGALPAADPPAASPVGFNAGATNFVLTTLKINSFYGGYTSMASVAGPAKGTVSYNLVTTSINYTPGLNQCGTDSWTYRASGPAGFSSTRTGRVTIATPSAPVATSNAPPAIAYSTGSTNIPLSLSGTAPTSITIISQPGVGSVAATGSNTVGYTASATAYSGSVSFQYQANGPCTTSAVATVTVTVNPPPAPVITSAASATGTGGQAFSYTITATNAPTGFNATGLPAGLSINTGTGAITGTPTVSGPFTAMISATNVTGTTTQALPITINLVTPVITSALTDNATSGSPYTYSITANNLPASFNATGLPSGLSVNTMTGVISGTPVVAMGGPVNIMISATNATGTDTKTLVLTVSLLPPTITSAGTASGTSGTAFSYQITATDFPTSYGASGLPVGVSVNASTGLISGTPVVAMTTVFSAMVSATNGSGTTFKAVTITITLAPPVITSATTASGTATFSFSYQITASNGPTSFGASGLPAGLSVNTGTGLISGIPTALGTTSSMVTATNASGTATQAVTITIANQPAPTATPFSINVPFNSTTMYDLAASVSGAYTSVTIASPVAKGTLSLNGLVITYTPSTGYFGPDSFTFTATGPGGTSAPATGTLNVGTPPAPAASAKTVSVPFNTATAIDLTSSITGVATTVAVSVAPAHGSTSVSGKVVTYTPVTGYFGDDIFSYTATGPGGTSMPAEVTIKVTPLAPSAETVNFILPLNTPTTLDLAPFIKGTAITGVALVALPQHGTATVNGTKVTYSPKTDFFGADTFTYSAYGTVGSSPAATVKVTVVGRPDPSKNANVAGLLAAQSESAQRFARAQIANLQGRMETLHRSGDSGAAPAPGSATTPAQTARPTLAPGATTTEASKSFADSRDVANRSSAFLPSSYAGPVPAGTTFPFASELGALLTTRSVNVASLVAASSGSADDGATPGSSGSMGAASFWISGVANFGRRVATSSRNQLDFTTDGLSLGVDRRISRTLAAGIGVGFARDNTDIGSDGSKSRGQGASVAAYASYHPTQNTFIDGLLGAGSLNFKTQRYVAPIDSIASGDRSGSQLFASVAAGYEYRDKGYLLSPYARLDYAADRLKQSSESGAGQYALTYFGQTTPSLQGVLGLRAEALNPTNYGWATPRARVEYRREFQGDRDASIAYADLAGGPRFAITTGALARNTLLVGLGADFIRRGGLTIGLDYQLQHNFSKDSNQGIRLNFTQDLDALGSPSALRGFFSIPQKPEKIQVDAGFMFDDNVTRSKVDSDKRSDRAYSANIGKGFVFTFESEDNPRENLRALVNVTLGGEKFQIYDGLSRAIAGVDGEFQYRTSSNFDAVTFAVFGRTSVERYRSELRNGYRTSVGVSARQALTDRIDIFGALAHNERVGRSSVFTSRDNSVRVNLDYSLSDREVLYATGEYRRGRIFSTGRATLDNLDIADVFVLDDAFPGSQYFSYRFEANTVISTLGYNLGFGPRHSLDLSWRRAQSTPRAGSSTASGNSSYVADQYSIIYLIRF